MVYLLAALASHRQLLRLRAEVISSIEADLAARLSRRPLRLAWQGNGLALAQCGPEDSLDAAAAGAVAAAALDVLALLRSRREALFGFNLLLDVVPEDDPDPVTAALGRAALELVPDEELWMGPQAVPLFAARLSGIPRRGFVRVTTAAPAPASPPTGEAAAAASAVGSPASPAERAGIVAASRAAGRWSRPALVERVLECLTPRLNGEDLSVLYLHGPPGTGKTELVLEVADLLCGSRAHVLRTWALPGRRTPLAPFLNALDPAVLADVPSWLRGAERSAWEDLGGTLVSMIGGQPGRFPDHPLEDFRIAFALYARAWARRCAGMLVPALLACEGVEGYHPAARTAAAALIEELSAEPSVVPIVTSSQRTPPEELGGLQLLPTAVHPLGRRETRSLAARLYPGLQLPESVVRALRRRSGGRPAAVRGLLAWLAADGRIRADAAGYAWAAASDPQESGLPGDLPACCWELVHPLPEDSRLVLYACHLGAGMVDREGLLAFLEVEGFEGAAAERLLDDLAEAWLVAPEDAMAPRFPQLRRRLEASLGAAAGSLRDRFTRHLLDRWEQGAYPREVLLLSHFSRTGRQDLALRVLPSILRRKLDERDPAGARAFCAPARLGLTAPAGDPLRDRLDYIGALGRLRAAVFEERLEEAAEPSRDLGRLEHVAGSCTELRVDALLAQCRYFLSAGDTSSALDQGKRALMDCQESGEDPSGEREAYLLIGVTMLADGRVGEAVEYLGLAEHRSSQAGDHLEALRAGSYLSVAWFLEGRLDEAAEGAAAARRTAASLGQRGSELFLAFLEGRIDFQLGRYAECALAIERALCLTELYSLRDAEAVLDAWLARAMVYAGETVAGTGRLERLPDTRETLLFLAEAALFTGEDGAALSMIDRALATPAASRFPSAETEPWWDGFASIEGRSFGLARGGAYLQRPLTSLRGYLRARSAGATDAHDLGELARSVRPADLDPQGYLYSFLYACTLPEEPDGEADDKATVMSKAIKGLQARAARIAEPARRASFLGANRWNRLVMEEARVRRLA